MNLISFLLGMLAVPVVFIIVAWLDSVNQDRRAKRTTKAWLACRCDPAGCPVHHPVASERQRLADSQGDAP